MKIFWRTVWQGQAIVVYRDDTQVDRLDASQIERVVLVHRGSGNAPGDVVLALIELESECLIFPAETGITGPVNFERQAFWTERACVYWVAERRAPLPRRMRRGSWVLPFAPEFMRVPRAQLAGRIERWPLQGPQTWEQRKWQFIADRQPFASKDDSHLGS